MLNHVPPFTVTPSEDLEWVIFGIYNPDTGTYSSKAVRLEDLPGLIREGHAGKAVGVRNRTRSRARPPTSTRKP